VCASFQKGHVFYGVGPYAKITDSEAKPGVQAALSGIKTPLSQNMAIGYMVFRENN